MRRLAGERSGGFRRAAVALLVAALAAPALGGCRPAPAERGERGPAGFERYFAQEVEWAACEGSFSCAEVEAPLDWADPSSEPITLALIRDPAMNAPERVVFVNPGGPGGSGVDFVATPWAPATLHYEADVIGWDPRGVGRSTRVECGDDREKDEFLYGTFDAPYGTTAWLEELAGRVEDRVAACAESGDLLAHIDTASSARDLDLLRALVGGDKLDYLGFSYGTFLGATYAELFPDKVGRMVLDGAVDPTLTPFELTRAQYRGFESALHSYAEWCLGEVDCPLVGGPEGAFGELDRLLAGVDRRSLTARDGRELDSATFGVAISAALYSDQLWPALSDAIRGVREGDPDVAMALADFYYERGPDGRYASNLTDAYLAVTCVDDDFRSDSADTLQRVAELDAAAPTLGRYLAFDDFAVVDLACAGWPVPPAPQPAEYDAAGAPPILVVGTTNDPATPYAWARSLADQLDSGRLLTFHGEGHTAYGAGNACVHRTVEGFLLDGTVPAEDAAC
ncbi:alpha/beta hydrolase [Naasia sp. SYSU D00057]|uniref:alpha/beta hydrolase n=1 Tax=Naasia sp. SYSU D00057 TaxID=2817380 RepID=UPI001B30345B|nr:alpha/beta hydrolase [Naasia sp. SYSU D00057]